MQFLVEYTRDITHEKNAATMGSATKTTLKNTILIIKLVTIIKPN